MDSKTESDRRPQEKMIEIAGDRARRNQARKIRVLIGLVSVNSACFLCCFLFPSLFDNSYYRFQGMADWYQYDSLIVILMPIFFAMVGCIISFPLITAWTIQQPDVHSGEWRGLFIRDWFKITAWFTLIGWCGWLPIQQWDMSFSLPNIPTRHLITSLNAAYFSFWLFTFTIKLIFELRRSRDYTTQPDL